MNNNDNYNNNYNSGYNNNGNGYRQLFKSRNNRVLCGVCGGIAEYFNIDPTLIRLAWALFGLTGSGILVYFIAAIIIPDGI